MLLLNDIQPLHMGHRLHFNTSYVVIKRRLELLNTNRLSHFNTSYVVIKLQGMHNNGPVSRFQYILCCY